MTAQDLADDLRHFLARDPGSHSVSGAAVAAPPEPPSAAERADTSAVSALTPASTGQPVRIVPKGLRSFDAQDADFFLELLPGPRDRDGLPDSIRFWKSRIEERDPDSTFAVGLIYGPSGCGKSSLVKAGLLPRLSDEVLVVYVEAAAGETEARLQAGLRKHYPALPGHFGMKEMLAALRRGQGIPGAKKVLIVLDQFEQWLHAPPLAPRGRGQGEGENTELVQALRQCDGGRVQCIVMVRDDFWMGATRFMRELEIRLLEGQNSAAVDLFPMRHAEKVLAALGRAFGALPESPAEPSRDQKQFIQQAVHGLAQDGKIICVRLALFAEMMKARTWTPAALRGRRHRGRRRHVSRRDVQRGRGGPGAPLSPGGGSRGPEGTVAGIGDGHQGPHAVAGGIAPCRWLCQPRPRFRGPGAHSRRRAAPDHAHRSRGRARAAPRRCRPASRTISSRMTIWCRRCGNGLAASKRRRGAAGRSCCWRTRRPSGPLVRRIGNCRRCCSGSTFAC